MVTTTTTTKDFWDKASSLIAVTEKHPFLVAMVDGTLKEENFRYYVIQDALYLQDFADCLRRLSKNPDISKDDSERLEKFAKGAEEAEMSLHNSFFKQWDINAEGVEQMPHTLLYTSYMKRIVATCCHAEGLACLLPCFWVYAHVGELMLELRSKLGDSVQRLPQYDAWISMYGGEEFHNEVRDYISMVDKVLLELANDDKTIKEMEKHFIMSCKLEHMFWDQANILMKWPNIVSNTKTSNIIPERYDSLS